jgi:hypothetical protein
VQDHFARGDWPTGVRESLSELAKEFGDFGKEFGKDFGFGGDRCDRCGDGYRHGCGQAASTAGTG